MRNLTDCFEGLLDADFDVSDEVLTIRHHAKRLVNDLYTMPPQATINALEKRINPDIPITTGVDNVASTWINRSPAAQRILSWLESKPISWLTNKLDGEFYTAFLNQCLTKAGSKVKWKVWVHKWGAMSGGKAVDFGWKVSIEMCAGSKWIPVARLAVQLK